MNVDRVFQLIEGDDDVLLIDKDTFTVSRFKELLTQDFQRKNIIKSHLGNLVAGQVAINLAEFKWQSSLLDCQFLKVGSKGWQKGQIRSQFSFFADDNIEVHLEFSPDESPKPESLLDDLRELPEYKQQL